MPTAPRRPFQRFKIPRLRFGFRLFSLLILFFAGWFIQTASAAPPGTFTVTTTDDSGPGSLREAVTQANASGGTIDFNFSLPAVISLQSPLPTVTNDLSITGPGANRLTVSGNGTFRILDATGAGVDLSLSGLTFANGFATSGVNAGAVEFNDAGILDVRECQFSGNGGTNSFQSVFYSNGATELRFYACAIVGNSLTGLVAESTPVTLVNTTVGNNARGVSVRSQGACTVVNCSIVNNRPGIGFTCGNIAAVTMTNTLLFNNGFNLARLDSATLVSGGGNLIGDSTFSAFTTPAPSDIVPPDALSVSIAGLEYNGGPTLSYAQLPGSVGINAGINAAVASPPFPGPPFTDQRGAGFPRIVNGTVDIGAYEVQPPVAAVVTNTNDSGPGSLREAVTQANIFTGTITFNLPLPAVITLQSALPTLNRNIAMTGPGANQLTVRRDSAPGTPAFRLIEVSSGFSVTLTGLTLSNGLIVNDSGGAILNNGALTLNQCAVTGSQAGLGGGIYSPGPLTLNGSTISGNIADAGGGMLPLTDLAMDGCTVENNTGTFGGGGMILSFNTAVIRNSTFSGNTGGDGGGAIINDSATLTMTNCTIAGNSVTGLGFGGGILNSTNGQPASVTLTNCTFTDNLSSDSANGAAVCTIFYPESRPSRSGAAIWRKNGTAAKKVVANTTGEGANTCYRNTIFNGTGAQLAAFPFGGTAANLSLGNNLSSDGTGNLTGTGDLPNTNPQLGPLAFNGGPTRTCALPAGSPALDGGFDTTQSPFNLATDQRGAGFPRKTGAGVDIGAFEFTPPNLVNSLVSLTITSVAVQPAACGAQGYANDLVLTGTLTNISPNTLSNLGFQVVEIAPANGTPPPIPFRLISADGATCISGGLAGAVQSLPSNVVLAPGESAPVTFVIAAPAMRRIHFFVNVLGQTDLQKK